MLCCSKLEIPTTLDSSPATKCTPRPRHRGRKSTSVHDNVDTEVIFKTEPGATSSPQGRQSSPRRSPLKRTKTAATEEMPRPVHGEVLRNRRSSKEKRPTQMTLREMHPDSCMPPPLTAAVNSATSSSRTTSPDRPLPHLTAAVIPTHHLYFGFPQHQPDVVTDVLGWKLVPDEFLHQQPQPPSLIYGAHHLLRLFGESCVLSSNHRSSLHGTRGSRTLVELEPTPYCC